MGWSARRSRGLAPQPAVDSASVVNTGAWGPRQVPVGGTTGFRATLSAFVQMSVLFGEQILSVLHGPRYTPWDDKLPCPTARHGHEKREAV